MCNLIYFRAIERKYLLLIDYFRSRNSQIRKTESKSVLYVVARNIHLHRRYRYSYGELNNTSNFIPTHSLQELKINSCWSSGELEIEMRGGSVELAKTRNLF